MTETQDKKPNSRRRIFAFAVLLLVTAAASAAIAALLVNIFVRKQEAKDPYLKLVNVTEDTTDPRPWGMNWPRQYDGYKRTSEPSRTNFGGGDALPAEKAEKNPWLVRMYAGYAFSLDYRDRRGHAYMLLDQEKTRRVTERPQPGACLNCHSSVMPALRHLGKGDVNEGFLKLCAMPYKEAHDLTDDKGNKLIQHPVSCVDCHDPKTMNLRVTRPAFITGIRTLKEHQGVKDYDPNRDANRQEMRTYVCAQCHVEYYFKGKDKTLTFPWAGGLKVEEIEAYYDQTAYADWTHAESGAPMLKAQHPEFELWSQGIHSRSGVACADCHMPYRRDGAMKVSDHYIRSPLLNINNSCQVCHHYPEAEIQSRAAAIQGRNHDLTLRAAAAMTGMLDAVAAAKKAGASEQAMAPVRALHRKAQWRLDFISSENSMGFHAPQEAARLLGESIDYFRQAQLLATQTAAGEPKK